jgi:hypothetical protein
MRAGLELGIIRGRDRVGQRCIARPVPWLRYEVVRAVVLEMTFSLDDGDDDLPIRKGSAH